MKAMKAWEGNAILTSFHFPKKKQEKTFFHLTSFFRQIIQISTFTKLIKQIQSFTRKWLIKGRENRFWRDLES